VNQRELFLRHVAQTSELPLLGEDLDIVSAAGVTLYDRNGKEYLDLISGISVSNIGHCHPQVVKAIEEQTKKFMHLMVYGEFNQAPQVKYAHFLAQLLPESLNCVYFTTSGSESVDGAVKLAKRYTGRSNVVSFTDAYHGSSQGALSLMGNESLKNRYRPLIPGIQILNFNDLNAILSVDKNTAAVIIELIQGEAGVRAASNDFVKKLSQRCKSAGTLLIVDEIQTGFGRAGTLFAFERYDIVPDILVVAKGMGGGLPIGAIISSGETMSSFSKDPALGHINTFGGNAVCVAAAQACLEVIVRGKLWLRAQEIEKQVNDELKHSLIREIRMTGALGAVDFGNSELNMKVISECLKQGIVTDWFLFCNTAMRLAPPLTISQHELSQGLKKITTILDAIKQ
jgi:acetylornithine/N-succinyldiaminopimelate aminotransferase